MAWGTFLTAWGLEPRAQGSTFRELNIGGSFKSCVLPWALGSRLKLFKKRHMAEEDYRHLKKMWYNKVLTFL
jgi:hypothetical protein